VKRRSSDTRSEEEMELRHDDIELGSEKIAKHEKSEDIKLRPEESEVEHM
jgi:hypothetical protein